MSDRQHVREPSSERSPWSRQSELFSGAFLLALALLGIVLATAGGGSDHTGPEKLRAAAGRSVLAPAADRKGDGCDLAAGDRVVPGSTPPAARWATVGSMQVPENPGVFGPQRSGGPWNTCFAHDPSGALLAAMNLWAEGTAVPAGQLFQRLAVGAPEDLGSTAQLDLSGPVQFAGYRYDSYTPSQAQVQVVFTGPEGKLLAVVTSMVWRAGDWKYLFPAGGAPPMQVLADLTGYVPWSSF